MSDKMYQIATRKKKYIKIMKAKAGRKGGNSGDEDYRENERKQEIMAGRKGGKSRDEDYRQNERKQRQAGKEGNKGRRLQTK